MKVNNWLQLVVAVLLLSQAAQFALQGNYQLAAMNTFVALANAVLAF